MRKDGKDWTDDKELRNWVREKDSSLIVVTRKSINDRAEVLFQTGEVIHENQSNTGLLALLKKRDSEGIPIQKPSIRKSPMSFGGDWESVESRTKRRTDELNYFKSGRANHPDIARKIRDCDVEIKEFGRREL